MTRTRGMIYNLRPAQRAQLLRGRAGELARVEVRPLRTDEWISTYDLELVGVASPVTGAESSALIGWELEPQDQGPYSRIVHRRLVSISTATIATLQPIPWLQEQPKPTERTQP